LVFTAALPQVFLFTTATSLLGSTSWFLLAGKASIPPLGLQWIRYLLRLLSPMLYMISRREASKAEVEKTKGLKEKKCLPSLCLLPFTQQ